MGMVVIQPYILVSKLKKTKTEFLCCTDYLNSINNHIKQDFCNSSSCATTLSKLLTPCLTAFKIHVIKYCEKVYERSVYFGLLKIQVKFQINLKLEISMRPVCLLMIFSTLYISLPHNLIKDKLIGLIERTSNREGSPNLASNDRNTFFLHRKKKLKNIMHCLVKMYMTR